MKKSVFGLSTFAYCVLDVVSSGNKEGISVVERHFDNGDIFEYLTHKYPESFCLLSPENGGEINQYFSELSAYVKGNERRKFCVDGEENGLLLVLALVINAM